MIQVVDNFNYRGKKPNFDRDSFDTLYDMKNYSENSLDDGHISYCKETGKHYKFNSNNQSDPTTGKWVEQHEAVPADEEDITEQNGTLQLANKTYDKQSFSGLGRVYLRKNIVGDKNVLTQAMINKANTIYVIQYDYDLKEASINIPENCVLQFDGGSFSNGKLICNNTSIISNLYKIFDSIGFEGSIINDINVEWFGAFPSLTERDSTTEINNALEASHQLKTALLFSSGTYYHSGIIIPEYVHIKGAGIDATVLQLISGSRNNNVAIINNNSGISDLTISNYYDLVNLYNLYEGCGLIICKGSNIGIENNDYECTNTYINNIKITDINNIGLNIADARLWVFNFSDITITRCANIGFYMNSSDNNFDNFNISHCQNMGMYIAGGHCRFSNFKVFVCGTNYLHDGEDGWLHYGVHLLGNNHILTNFDIQESGKELLVSDNGSGCNIIIATLDRPGFRVDGVEQPNAYKEAIITSNGNYGVLMCSARDEDYIDPIPNIGNNNDIKIISKGTLRVYPKLNINELHTGPDRVLDFTNDITFTSAHRFTFKDNIAFITNSQFGINSKKINSGSSIAFRVFVHKDLSRPSTISIGNLFFEENPTSIPVNLTINSRNEINIDVHHNMYRGITVASDTQGDYYYIDALITIKKGIVSVILWSSNDINVISYRADIIKNITSGSFNFSVNDSIGFNYIHFFTNAIYCPIDITAKTGLLFELIENDTYINYYKEIIGNVQPNMPQLGDYYYDRSLNVFGFYDGTNWKNSLGNVLGSIRGNTANMPTNVNYGYEYFNSEHTKKYFWINGAWVDARGIRGVGMSYGSSEARPTGIGAGFEYFDTTINKPIFWDGAKWIDATGATV